MAIVELQIREQAFAELVKNELNRRRLPGRTIDALPQLSGKLLQRIECVSAQVAGSGLESATTGVVLELVFHYNNTTTEVSAAGSLVEPPMSREQLTQLIQFSINFVNGAPTLRWQLAGQSGDFDMDAPDDIAFRQGAVIARDGIVAIRLSTDANESMLGPIKDRLGNDDWAQLVPGDLIAEVVRAQFAEAIEAELDDELRRTTPVSGAWFASSGTQQPFAGVSVTLLSVGACLLIDVPIDVQLIARFEPVGPSVRQTITLSWDPDSTWCEVAGALLFTPIAAILINGFAEGEASERFLGKAKPFEGFVEIARDENSLTYERTTLMSPTPTERFVFQHAEVTDEGLVTSGNFSLQNAKRNLYGEVSLPRSSLKANCPKRRVDVEFQPATLHLRDPGVEGGPPRCFTENGAIVGVEFDPPGCWAVQQASANTWLDLALTFTDPPGGRLPPGTATSVFVHTDCGLRWIDLGTIPEDHAAPSDPDVARMLSICMALRDPWGEGVFNLDWLVDPPDLRDGIDPLRHWTIAVRDLPAERLDIVAVRGDEERHLRSLSGPGDATADVTTEADEVVRLKAPGGAKLAVPDVWQRWIVPLAAIPVGDDTVVASSHYGIGIRERGGRTALVEPDADGGFAVRPVGDRHRDAKLPEIEAALSRAEAARDGIAAASIARIDRHTVALTHRGKLVIGTALERMRL